jgi:hypothetical protein
VRTLLQVVSLAGALGGIAAAQPVIFTALNSASSSALLSPGSWVSVYGFNFAAAPQTAQSLAPLPVTLGGVSVTVGGASVSLSYVPACRCVTTGPFCWTAPGPVVYPPQLMGFF